MMASKISGAHDLGGESLPAASYGIFLNLKKGLFFAMRDGWKSFVFCFVHISGQLCLYHRPGQLSPHDTGRGVKTVTLRWVRAPNERTLFRIHDTVVGLVE